MVAVPTKAGPDRPTVKRAIESAEFHHDEPDRNDSAAAVDSLGTFSVARAARGAGDSGVGLVCAGVDNGWARRLPGAEAGADYDDGNVAGSDCRQDYGDRLSLIHI